MGAFNRLLQPRHETVTTALDPRGHAIITPSAPIGAGELRPVVLFDIYLAPTDIAVPFRDSEVQAANRHIADSIGSGRYPELPRPLAEWFRSNHERPMSPVEFGYTWYPGMNTGHMQLIDTRALELDRNPRAGSLVWGSRCVINRWALTAIEVEAFETGDGSIWRCPAGFASITAQPLVTEQSGFVVHDMGLRIADQLGSESLTREFTLMLHTALLLEGVFPGDVNNSNPTRWRIRSRGVDHAALVRAAVRSLYALGNRLPWKLTECLPTIASDTQLPSETPELTETTAGAFSQLSA